MNRPPPPHRMVNMYRAPRPFNNRWRPRGPHPSMGFQCRPNTYPRPSSMNIRENNEEHWCETCDRGFATADLLDKHKYQHQKCNIDGCQFVAHPKVITKHIQMQHSSGLYKKIAKLDNPEEINKWREERKKKYPTRTNIEKKAAECKEKIERGEKMALKRERSVEHKSSLDGAPGSKRRFRFDRRDQNHKANQANQNQSQKHTLNNRNHPPSKKIPRVTPEIPTVVEKNKLKPFAGILSMEMEDNIDKTERVSGTLDCDNGLIEDDCYEEPVANETFKIKSSQEPILCGALSSLMCDYGSSDEEIADEKINKPHSDGKITNTDKPQKIVNKDIKMISNDRVQEAATGNVLNEVDSVSKAALKNNNEQEIETKPNDSDDDSPEEVKTIKSNVQEPNDIQKDSIKDIKLAVLSKKNNSIRNNQRPNYRYIKYKVPSTLLHKLLHKEIRQERNIVLQCIRYIKNMNYFNKT